MNSQPFTEKVHQPLVYTIPIFHLRKQYSHDTFRNNFASFWLLSWDKLPEVRMSQQVWTLWWLSRCDARLLSTRMVPISPGVIWGCQFLCMLPWWHPALTLEWPEAVSAASLSRMYNEAFRHHPIHKADTFFRHLLCEMMRPQLKIFRSEASLPHFVSETTNTSLDQHYL